MSDALSSLLDAAASPLAWLMAGLLVAQLLALVRLWRVFSPLPEEPEDEIAAASLETPATETHTVPRARKEAPRQALHVAPEPLAVEEQMTRISKVIERASASAETAARSHTDAARHLDSAEYELGRLYEETTGKRASRKKAVVPSPA